MIVADRLKDLHTRDPISIQLGNLASSVKRLGYLIHTQRPENTVRQLLVECRSCAGWTSPNADSAAQGALTSLQIDLANWERGFEDGKTEEPWRIEVNAACEQWSQKLLELSGLLGASLSSNLK